MSMLRAMYRLTVPTLPGLLPLRHWSAPAALAVASGLAASFFAAAPTAQASTSPEEAEYRACMNLAHRMPDSAFETALAWRDDNGAELASHCLAVALMNMEQFEAAGIEFEKLATQLDKTLAPDILAQAAYAWLAMEDYDRAYAVQSQALELRPDDPELLLDRSLTLAETGNYWDALDDLNRASELAPTRADLLVYRASAYRMVEAEELALEDVNRALELNPLSADAYLERGNLRRLAGDKKGARQDWLKVVSLAPEKSAVATSARANLEKMDLKVE
ncbi:tetratricopeptide repeat protein [Rhodovibrionaceae bacterium A322]